MNINELDLYLSQQEQRYSDLVENTEKTINWADGVKQTDYAIIYLHGFSATRQEIEPVPSMLAKELGANIFYTRLRGHGRSEDAMSEATMQDWLNDSKQAYDIATTIGKKVIIISTSTGSTLAAWLIAQDFVEQDKIIANIMVSPNFDIKSKTGYLVRYFLGLRLARLIHGGPYYSFTPENELHAKYWTERYRLEVLEQVLDLIDLVKQTDKPNITIPQLVIYSPNDKVIDVKQIFKSMDQFTQAPKQFFKMLNSKNPAQHVIAGNICSPSTNQETLDHMLGFITEQLDKQQP